MKQHPIFLNFYANKNAWIFNERTGKLLKGSLRIRVREKGKIGLLNCV